MFDTKFYEDKVPSHLLEGLLAWGQKLHPVGNFLTAVLSNDLQEAVARADDESIKCIRHIAMFVYNELPSGCHGSPERVRDWMNQMSLEQDDE